MNENGLKQLLEQITRVEEVFEQVEKLEIKQPLKEITRAQVLVEEALRTCLKNPN